MLMASPLHEHYWIDIAGNVRSNMGVTCKKSSRRRCARGVSAVFDCAHVKAQVCYEARKSVMAVQKRYLKQSRAFLLPQCKVGDRAPHHAFVRRSGFLQGATHGMRARTLSSNFQSFTEVLC